MSQDGLIYTQDEPRCGQNWPKESEHGAKMAPRWPQMCPDRAKMAPRWAVMEIKIDAKMPFLVDPIF